MKPSRTSTVHRFSARPRSVALLFLLLGIAGFLWVLRDNPSRWFYQRLGGKPVAEASIQFAGAKLPQTAFVWDPIEKLLAASPQES